MICFIDELNMPLVDTYGTQQPIALLKLLLERDGWYDRKDLQWKRIVDVSYVGACGTPGGARNAMDPRFMSLFSSFNATFPKPDAIKRIFGTIIKCHLAPFAADVQGVGSKLADLTFMLFNKLVEKLPPTPSKFHVSIGSLAL